MPRSPGGRLEAGGKVVGARLDWSGAAHARATRLTARNAYYGLGIIGAYGLVDLPIAALYGADVLGTSDAATRVQTLPPRTAADSLGPTITYDAEIDNDSPVSHWKLGEGGASSAVDRKGLLNLLSSNQGDTGAATSVAGLLSNNGASAATELADHQVFTPASTVYAFYSSPVWSAEMWLKANVLVSSTPVRKISVFSQLGVNVNGTLSISAVDGGAVSRTYLSTNQITIGATYHVVGTHDGLTLRLYVNGVLWASGPCVGLTDLDRGIAIGNTANNSNNPDLVLDEVAWYNAPLSQARIQAHYNVGAGLVALGTQDAATRAAVNVARSASDSLGSAQLLDSFTDASAPRDLTTYNGAWSAPAVSGEFSPKTTAGGAVTGLAGNLTSAYYPSVSQADVRISATVATKPANGSWLELLARVQNPGTGALNCYLLVAFANAGTDSIELYKFVGGVGTQLRVFQSAEYSAGDVLALDVTGTTISFYKNGVLIDSGTDLTVTGAGTVGIRLLDNSGALDNVAIGGGVSDAATVTTGGVPSRSASDTLGTSDAATRAATVRTRAAADSLGTSDVATRTLARSRTATDALATSDAAIRAPTAQARSAGDVLGTSDAATRAATVRTRAATDTLGTSDAATRTTAQPRAATDSLGTSDAATRAPVVRARSATDTLGTNDVATRTLAQPRTGSDTLATSDAATRAATVRVRTATDTLGTTDAATRVVLRARTVTDSLGTSDAATRTATVRTRTAIDTLGTSDAAFTGSSPLRTASDALGTSDAATRAPTLRARTATDTLGTSDAASRAAIARARSSSDVLGTSDLATRVASYARFGLDVLGTTDGSVRSPVSFGRLASDTLGTSDQVTQIAVSYRFAADELGTSDSAAVVLRRFASDTLGTSDQATVTVRTQVAGTVLVTDSASALLAISDRPQLELALSSGVLTISDQPA